MLRRHLVPTLSPSPCSHAPPSPCSHALRGNTILSRSATLLRRRRASQCVPNQERGNEAWAERGNEAWSRPIMKSKRSMACYGNSVHLPKRTQAPRQRTLGGKARSLPLVRRQGANPISRRVPCGIRCSNEYCHWRDARHACRRIFGAAIHCDSHYGPSGCIGGGRHRASCKSGRPPSAACGAGATDSGTIVHCSHSALTCREIRSTSCACPTQSDYDRDCALDRSDRSGSSPCVGVAKRADFVPIECNAWQRASAGMYC
jgi:hypothetical protein